MNRLHHNIAKSAKAKLALALLAMFAVTAGGLVALAKQNALAIAVSPATRTFTQGQAQNVSFVFTVSNSQGAPALEATGIPSGVTATWSAGSAGSSPPGQAKKCTVPCTTVGGDGTVTLSLSVPYDLTAGTYPIAVKVTAPNGSVATATATLTSLAAPNFTISGVAAGPMTLDGPAQPINLSIANPYDHALTVLGLNVAIDTISKAGCAASNFTLTQVPSTTTYSVPANSTLVLSGSTSQPKPAISWPNDPHNAQNACIGAVVTFKYSASGRTS